MESYEKVFNCICRLCLKYDKIDNMVSLFDKNSGKVNYYGKAVTTFASVLLKKDDSFPPSMCRKCLVLLKQCICFKFMCESSEKQLGILKNLVTDNFMQRVVEFTLFKLNNLMSSAQSNNITDKNLNKQKTEINNIVTKIDKNITANNKTTDWLYEIEFESLDDTPKIESKTQKSGNPDEILDTLEKIVLPNKKLNSELFTKKPRRKIRRKLKYRFVKNVNKDKSTERRCYVCNICNKILANQQTYENHMQRHNGCRFICERCGKGFPVLSELQMHLVSRHGTGPYIQCQHCPFKAPRRFDLMEHERIHSGERPFTCDKCGLTFRRRGIWKNHLVYHTERKIQCSLCPKKFFLRSQMMAHYNSVHDRLYMYVCGKCGAMYAKPVTVRRHMVDRHGIPREMQGKILRVKKSSVSGMIGAP